MRLYITARFKGQENKPEIEELCAAVEAAGMEDFCFIRDVENYQKTFNDPKDLWERSKLEIQKCDALLIDVSDSPSDGRVVEAGIAYALGLPIFVIAKNDVSYKNFFNGIATQVIRYEKYGDITAPLSRYLKN